MSTGTDDLAESLFAADVFEFADVGSDGSASAGPPGTGAVSAGTGTYVSGGAAASGFNIELAFLGGWAAGLQDAFIASADWLSQLVTGDLQGFFHDGRWIDDLRIEATLADIDGIGGVLGQAGPTLIRTSNLLPIEGLMQFDAADADRMQADGLWEDVVLHEMMHVLGFGTMWDEMGLLEATGDELRFTGNAAWRAYLDEFPSIAAADPGRDRGVPVETHGSAQTAGGHWDEAVFGDEMMTGYIARDAELSRMSVAALSDMGYATVADEILSDVLRCGADDTFLV